MFFFVKFFFLQAFEWRWLEVCFLQPSDDGGWGFSILHTLKMQICSLTSWWNGANPDRLHLLHKSDLFLLFRKGSIWKPICRRWSRVKVMFFIFLDGLRFCSYLDTKLFRTQFQIYIWVLVVLFFKRSPFLFI